MTKKLFVIGLSYIGLPTAELIASNKTTIIGVDVGKRAVTKVNIWIKYYLQMAARS